MLGDVPCSSTGLRAALAAGDVATARLMLGRDYQLRGRVVRGDGLGRTIGVPTANIALPGNLLLPAYGVYAVRATIAGEVHAGVANFGVRPTIHAESGPRLEVHLLAGRHELYGQAVTVEFVARLRAEAKFEGLTELKKQIALDSAGARAVLAEAP
jgi:riboflavin kinase/FMN adenylyltransferase